jgi:glycosyltransferase involved in cell wall biosynthesis
MEVYYDSEMFLLQNNGGVSRYFSEIISAYLSDQKIGIEPVLTFTRSDNQYLKEMNDKNLINIRSIRVPYYSPVSAKRMLLTYGVLKTANSTISSAIKVGQARGKMFHATYYRPNILESLGYKNLAITIHDFIPEKLGWNGIKNPHLGKRKLTKRADIIFCVSESTANDLYEIYKVPEDNVHIIPHGVSNLSTLEKKLKSSGRINILYVGGRWGYKNFKQLAEAMNILWEKGFDIQLRTVGSKFSPTEIETYFKPMFRKNWKNFEKVSDYELYALYSSATMLVVTSKMEGFGLPILESFSQGTLVLASDIPVFREVCGSSGKYFEIGNVESLVESIEQSLEDAFNPNLISDRLSHASKFSWNNAAEKMSLVYKNFLE